MVLKMQVERFPKDLAITLDDFKNSDCLSIVNNIEGNSYSDYWSFLSKVAKEKIDNQDLKSGKILWLVADTCSMMLNPSSRNEPFEAYAIMYQTNSRSAIPDDFTEDELQFFEDIVEICEDYRVKSRLADILWLKKSPKKTIHLEMAINNYQSFSLEYDDILNDSKEAWERAIRLSLWTNKPLSSIEEKLLSEFEKSELKNGYHIHWIQKLLFISKVDEKYYEVIFDKLKEFANEFKAQKDFHRARDYFEDCKNWTKDIDTINELTVKVAELYVSEAEQVNALASGHFYEKAIEEYRTIANKYRDKFHINEKISEVHNKMNNAHLLALDHMQPMNLGPVDLSKTIEYSIKRVSGLPFFEALLQFVNLFDNTKVDEQRRKAIESIDKFSISRIFGATHIAHDGRVTAKRHGMDFSDRSSEAYEDTVLHEMIQNYDLEIELQTKGMIIPAFQQLLSEHRITKNKVYELCSNSSIVFKNRIIFWIEGIYNGFENNFIVSTHLLIPQIEHLIRTKMKEIGLKTSMLKDGVETENGLSALLKHEKISDVIDENLVFELKALLTEQVGANLRNNVAHGLSEIYSLKSIHAIYLWWLCLKLIVNTNLLNENQELEVKMDEK